jgi:ribosomal protein S4
MEFRKAPGLFKKNTQLPKVLLVKSLQLWGKIRQRLGMVLSPRRGARQLVSHRHITVNGDVVPFHHPNQVMLFVKN